MKSVYAHSKTYTREEALAKRAQQAQQAFPSQENDEKRARLRAAIEAYLKLAPNDEIMIDVQQRIAVGNQRLTDAEIETAKRHLIQRIPYIRQTVEALNSLVYKV